MKKILALLLALCLTASMFGCGTITPEAPTTGTTGTTAPTTPSSKPITYTSYTVSDEEAAAARNEIIATVGDRQLTNSEFSVCYWMGVYSFLSNNGSYVSLYGLDLTKPLDEQGPTDNENSWQELFIEDALAAWHVYAATALAGEALGVEMPDYLKEDLDGLRDLMAESAEKGKFESVDAMIQKEAGAGATADTYYDYTLHYYEYLACMEYVNEITKTTDADIEKYFTEHEKELAESKITKDSGNVFGVRHILIGLEGGTKDEMTGKTTYSEEEWEACRVKAQKLMDEWAGGTATEETFANYAKEHSTDPGSKDNGGLYEGLDKDTSFVEPFKNWYLDESRQVGDYGLVKTDYGYHIMYMSSIEAKWIAHCRDAILKDAVDAFIEDAQEKYPIETDMDKIALGEVELASNS